MEKIFSATPFYYGASRGAPNTVRIAIELKDFIDGSILEDVVETTAAERFPYFKCQVFVEDESYTLKENKNPIVVKKGKEPILLGGPQANGHLLSVAYDEKMICFDWFHGLADGAGMLPFIKTVLYYYCSRYYHEELDSRGVCLWGDPIAPEETVEPYPEKVDADIEPFGRYKGQPAFQLPEFTKSADNCQTVWNIKLKEDAFLNYSRDRDASPAAMAAVLLFKAIEGVHQEREEPVVCGMAMNIRPVLGKNRSHYSLVSQLFLPYKKTMANMDISKLCTCARGMIMLQSQPENIWISVRNNIRFIQEIQKQPSLVDKKAFMKKIVERSMHADTFKVSYVGRTDLGAASQYVDTMHTYVDITGAGIMVEINAVNGHFYLSFMQETGTDLYLNSFLKQLEQEKIWYEVGKPGTMLVPGIDF